MAGKQYKISDGSGRSVDAHSWSHMLGIVSHWYKDLPEEDGPTGKPSRSDTMFFIVSKAAEGDLDTLREFIIDCEEEIARKMGSNRQAEGFSLTVTEQ